MIKLSDKLLMETFTIYYVYCLACKTSHRINTHKPNKYGFTWIWDLIVEKPSFFPDLKIYHADGGVCHSVIVSGKVIYDKRSTHEMKGTVVDLPDFPKEVLEELLLE